MSAWDAAEHSEARWELQPGEQTDNVCSGDVEPEPVGSRHGSIAAVYDFMPYTLTMEWLHEQTSILDGRQTNLFVCRRFYRPVLLN